MLADFLLLFSNEMFHKYNSFYIIVGTLISGVAFTKDKKALYFYPMPESIKLSLYVFSS
jgi:hypothetical protein